MPEFTVIPKLIPPRQSMASTQKIPKIIWQTMKTNRVPVFIKTYADSWIDNNPEYEYRFFDDNDIIEFLKADFPDYLDGYKKLKYGASKADLWRYLIIYKYGGVYADMDCKCITSLKQWVNPDATFVTQLGTNKDICQWLIISIAQNPIFIKAAQKTLQNAEKNNCRATHYGFKLINNKLEIREDCSIIQFNDPVLGLFGPPIMQEAAEECFRDGSLSSILPYTQIVCVSGTTSCQMDGRVIHDTQNLNYKKSIKKIKVIHYNSRIERIKRKFISLF